MLPQMFTFLCEKRTGRIIQKIGRLVFVGRGMVGSFLGVFVCFWLVFLPGSFPCFYQFYLIFSFSFFSLSFSTCLCISSLLVLFVSGPSGHVLQRIFFFSFSSSLSLSLSHRYLCFSPQKCAQMIDTLLS